MPLKSETIPASKPIASEDNTNYFNVRNELFTRLFSYIRDNNVSMTVPVEAEIDNAKMKFYGGSSDKEKDLRDRPGVRVVDVPQRIVVSIGMRGAYRRSSFEKAKVKLEQWLHDNKKYRQAGEAYAVFWDAPFVPWFLKRSEVHVPINRLQTP